jgi:hypothetical protein
MWVIGGQLSSKKNEYLTEKVYLFVNFYIPMTYHIPHIPPLPENFGYHPG